MANNISPFKADEDLGDNENDDYKDLKILTISSESMCVSNSKREQDSNKNFTFFEPIEGKSQKGMQSSFTSPNYPAIASQISQSNHKTPPRKSSSSGKVLSAAKPPIQPKLGGISPNKPPHSVSIGGTSPSKFRDLKSMYGSPTKMGGSRLTGNIPLELPEIPEHHHFSNDSFPKNMAKQHVNEGFLLLNENRNNLLGRSSSCSYLATPPSRDRPLYRAGRNPGIESTSTKYSSQHDEKEKAKHLPISGIWQPEFSPALSHLFHSEKKKRKRKTSNEENQEVYSPQRMGSPQFRQLEMLKNINITAIHKKQREEHKKQALQRSELHHLNKYGIGKINYGNENDLGFPSSSSKGTSSLSSNGTSNDNASSVSMSGQKIGTARHQPGNSSLSMKSKKTMKTIKSLNSLTSITSIHSLNSNSSMTAIPTAFPLPTNKEIKAVKERVGFGLRKGGSSPAKKFSKNLDLEDIISNISLEEESTPYNKENAPNPKIKITQYPDLEYHTGIAGQDPNLNCSTPQFQNLQSNRKIKIPQTPSPTQLSPQKLSTVSKSNLDKLKEDISKRKKRQMARGDILKQIIDNNLNVEEYLEALSSQRQQAQKDDEPQRKELFENASTPEAIKEMDTFNFPSSGNQTQEGRLPSLSKTKRERLAKYQISEPTAETEQNNNHPNVAKIKAKPKRKKVSNQYI